MGFLGYSLIVASVVCIIIRPPTWLTKKLVQLRYGHEDAITDASDQKATDHDDTQTPRRQQNGRGAREDKRGSPNDSTKPVPSPSSLNCNPASSAIPPPPPPLPPLPPTIQHTTFQDPDSPITPRASTTSAPSLTVPRLSLADESSTAVTSKSPSSMMPPPNPARQIPSAARPQTLPQFPAPNSVQRARGPVPDRGPSGLSIGGLAPPPTHSSKPQKPSRKVTLDPGHSPLDWARISGPNADLRGVHPSTPYLRVTPSMLKWQTGRKGKDAWTALNGKVYNITPYAKFHPGGIPELMRGAARDGTKLFGEIHPWVNYETMLSACLVGLLVEEPEGASYETEMDRMD